MVCVYIYLHCLESVGELSGTGMAPLDSTLSIGPPPIVPLSPPPPLPPFLLVSRGLLLSKLCWGPKAYSEE